MTPGLYCDCGLRLAVYHPLLHNYIEKVAGCFACGGTGKKHECSSDGHGVPQEVRQTDRTKTRGPG